MKKATMMRNTASAILIAASAAGCANLPAPNRQLVAANDNFPPLPPKSPAPIAANDNFAPLPPALLAPVGGLENNPVAPRQPEERVPDAVAEKLKQHLVTGKDPSHVDELQPAFASQLADLFTAMPERLAAKTKILSGYRSSARQKVLFDQAVKKYGSAEAARTFVAPPGKSNHQRGIAVDFDYGGSAEARAWVHDHAAAFGLYFPMSWEPWHIEPVGSRSR